MIGGLLLLCGLTLTGIATWRGYVAARSALGPLAHPGEPTRAAVDAGRPFVARTRVRTAARQVVLAVGWLALAMYGLYLSAAGVGGAA